MIAISEVGTAWVRLVPSMRGFKKAAERELKGALAGPAREAGEDAGDEIGKGAAKTSRKRAKPAGQGFAKDFGTGVKSGLGALGDQVGAGLGEGLGDTKIDTRPLRAQLRDLAAEVNDDLRGKGLEFEVDAGRLAAIAKQVKATLEATNPELTIGARTSDVVAKVREQVDRDIRGVGEKGGEDLSDGMETSTRSGLGRWVPSVARWFAGAFSDESERGMRSRMTAGAGGLMRAFGGALGVAAKPTAMTVATAFSAELVGSLAGALASGVGKIAHGLGAVAALLPAAVATGILAFGTLKLAVAGVGDALSAGLSGDTEAFNEALKGLSPSARTFARSVAGMRDELDDLKSGVQENFFSQFADQTKQLGSTYLPVLKTAMGGVATSFGKAVSESMGFLTLPKTSGQVSMALGHMGSAVDNVAKAVQPMIRAFLPLITVGSTFLPKLTAGLGGAATGLASFMENAAKTGKLAEFIQRGLDKLKSLWETAQQLGRIFMDIWHIGSKVFEGANLGGGHLLDTIESAVDGFAKFLDTARGAEVLGQVLEAARAVIGSLMGTLQRVAGTLAQVFGPIMPDILDFIEAFSNLKSAVLDTALDALEPVLMGIGAVLAGVVMPALTALADTLANNRPVLQGIGIAILTLLVPAFVAWAISAGTAAIATIAAMLPIILLGAAIAALAALVIIHFDTIKRWISNVFNWVRDNWPLLLTILTGPIGIAVALIVSHWDKIKAAALAVFNWVKTNWPLLLAILTGPFGLAVLAISRNWSSIKAGATAVKNWIVGAFNAVVGFFASIPGRISSAASGMWDGISNAFKSMVNTIIGWWNGISFTLPTIDIPGFDPPGPGPKFGGVTLGGQTFSTPNIPMLADGAILGARPGGTLFVGGEGGEDEVVSPLSKLQAIVRGAMVDVVGADRAPAPAPSRLTVDVTGGQDELIRVVRKWIANNTTGDVQVALGPRR